MTRIRQFRADSSKGFRTMENWTEYSRFITSLVVIMDPFMAIPIFLSMTKGYSHQNRSRVVRIAIITVAATLIVTAFAGEGLLAFMGTSLGSFRVGGGIVLFMMALAMLQARIDPVRSTPHEEEVAASLTSVGVVPLAIPLLAGPGAMSTVVIGMQRSTAPYHEILVVGSILLVSAVLWLVLSLAVPIGKRLGDIGLNILNRIFGLILAAIAVEVIANGIKQLFPILVV
jgi:multiple antibiotic resistance protein